MFVLSGKRRSSGADSYLLQNITQFIQSHPDLETLNIRAGPSPFDDVPFPPHVVDAQEAARIGLIPESSSNEADEIYDAWRRREFVTVMAWASSSSKDLVGSAMSIAKTSPSLRTIRWCPYGKRSDASEVNLEFNIERAPTPGSVGLIVSGGLRWVTRAKKVGVECSSSPKDYVVAW